MTELVLSSFWEAIPDLKRVILANLQFRSMMILKGLILDNKHLEGKGSLEKTGF